ncbi:MAG: type II/IV secretion system ATPase subunit [archaeon]
MKKHAKKQVDTNEQVKKLELEFERAILKKPPTKKEEKKLIPASDTKELLRSLTKAESLKNHSSFVVSSGAKVLCAYDVKSDELTTKVQIIKDPQEFVLLYNCEYPRVPPATQLLMEDIRERLIEEVKVEVEEIVNPHAFNELKKRYKDTANKVITNEFKQLQGEQKDVLLNYLIHRMLGLGKLELLFADDDLEEIVINNAEEPTWVYHKKYGWLKSNISLDSEEQIHNYSSLIGRRVGREITSLHPLMDARLSSGDRVNATLSPISTHGNTITIRKFARKPWTMIDFLDPKVNTLNSKVAAMLWMAIQNEMNMLIAGGTGSGKTSMLNALTPFIPPNQRIVSIEDTRELQLPDFLHWVPMVTRSPNPEGKGEISMLDLMVNSLRQRPDRIIVGEVRRAEQAEVLFEAMHTGHAVYATLHADTVSQTYRRLVNPPINVPMEMLESLHLILVQFRQRQLNIRRTFQVAEVELPEEYAGELKVKFNILYKWTAKDDAQLSVNPSTRIINELEIRTGMNAKEIGQDLVDKENLLNWMLKHNLRNINDVGKLVSTYYIDPDKVLTALKKNEDPFKIVNNQ